MRLFIDALWSPARKGLTSWLSFVMSNCEIVTFPLVSGVRCGACLYRFLIFSLFLTLKYHVFENVLGNGAFALLERAKAPFSIIFSKVFKT